MFLKGGFFLKSGSVIVTTDVGGILSKSIEAIGDTEKFLTN